MKYITWFLVITMFLIGIAPRVDAGLSPSEVIAVSQTDRTSDLQKIQEFLEMKLVRERLEKLGFTPDEIQSKLNQLSDQQIHYFAQNLDDLQVGGDGLGIIIALLVIAILVVLLFQLTGHKVIVTK
ncbi:MAG: PA2779 family protein [Thermodesulfovibrionia bacterium]|nr:PA2779 family protein [Thermodesulfovibrionia bacterium]